MYICIYVNMYICIYVYMYICIYIAPLIYVGILPSPSRNFIQVQMRDEEGILAVMGCAKEDVINQPCLGMVTMPSIKMVMAGGWFMIVLPTLLWDG